MRSIHSCHTDNNYENQNKHLNKNSQKATFWSSAQTSVIKEENKTAASIHSFQCKADHQPLKLNFIYTHHTFFILKVQSS